MSDVLASVEPTGNESIRRLFEHVSCVLMVRGYPFPVPPSDLRLTDLTRTLSPDARRAVITAAIRRCGDHIKAQRHTVNLPPDVYADRERMELWTGVRQLDDEAKAEAVRAWPWARYLTLEEFYEQHTYLHPSCDEEGRDSENYLERLFLHNVLLPVLGEAALGRLYPQHRLPQGLGSDWRIDFLLRGEKDYAIECEGDWPRDPRKNPSFSTSARAQRIRAINQAGWDYTPYTYDDIVVGRAREDFERLCRDDGVLRHLLGASETAPPQDLVDAMTLLHHASVTIRQLHFIALAEIWEMLDQGEPGILLEIAGDSQGLAAIAFTEVAGLLQAVANLRDVAMPEIQIRLSYPPEWVPSDSLLPMFFDNPRWPEDGRDLRLDSLPPDRVHVGRGGGGRLFDVGWPEARQVLSQHTIRLARRLSRIHHASIEPEPLGSSRRTLDFFARWFFPEVAALKKEQFETIAPFLQDSSRLVILPTGYGKSLCYQLPALLRGGLCIVISPLRSLMADQIESLHANGIWAARSISGVDTPEQRAETMRRVSGGRVRLFYIAPERILIRSFVGEVVENAAAWRVWGLVVDEAHCVSEWGHDFRPSYLYIDRFRQRLEAHRSVNLLALTATASELVEQDVRQTLGIEADTVKTVSADRPEISFSVHPIKDPADRDNLLAEVVGALLPRALGREADELFRNIEDPQGVVLFAPYANGHGRTTRYFGVLHPKQVLEQAGVLHKGECQVHASQPVEVCPQCEGDEYDFLYNPRRCAAQGHQFDQPANVYRDTDWLRKIADVQRRFKKDEFPVIAATKGYGMGIDKRNIRGIVHIAFSSGMEGYYQESGRAARDGEHGHAALIFTPPHPNCRAQHLERADPEARGFLQTIEPPCVTNQGAFERWECPEGLPVRCDFGVQARFIQEAYPGVELDVKQAMGLYDKIRTAGQSAVRLYPRGEREEREADMAIYRLTQLGIIADHQKDYSKQFSAKQQTGSRLDVIVEPNSAWTIEAGKSALRESLHRLIASRGETRSQQQAIEDRLARLPVDPERVAVEAMLRLLIADTYNSIKSMRYTMLYNEWCFAENAFNNKCLRTYIRQVFDRNPVDEECQFCSVCNEELDFQRNEAVVPAPNATLERLGARISEQMSDFDFDALLELAAAFEAQGALGGMQARVAHLLESAPQNQSLLLLAAEAASRRGLRAETLRRYFEVYGLNEVAPHDFQRACRVVERVMAVDIEAAASLADQKGRILDTPKGRRFLHRLLLHPQFDGDPRREAMAAIVLAESIEECMPLDLLEAARNRVNLMLGAQE